VGGSIKEGIKVGISSNEGIKKSQKLELKDICRYKTADCILLAQYTLHLPYNFNCLTNTPRIATWEGQVSGEIELSRRETRKMMR
jgi:hypothetical protein